MNNHSQSQTPNDVGEPVPPINRFSQHEAIFRASFFTGGAQIAALLSNLVRMKFVALVLGVTGVGANGLLFQTSSLVQTFLGLGIGSSGVKSVAAAHGTKNLFQLSRTVKALRVWVWATGLLCLVFCVAMSHQLSLLIFGNKDHAIDFIVLGFAALLQQVSAGQTAILRGMRKIKELAKVNIASAVVSLVLAGPCLWFFGVHGIAISFLASAASGLFFSWSLSRREHVESVQLTRADILEEGRELISTGVTFVGTAIAGGLASYLNALVVRYSVGLEGNGFYQAGMGITFVLVGFVLSAMGQDYYPKLVASLHSGKDISDHIHDQVDMALLMGLPLLVGVSSMAPWVLHLVYSEKFIVASEVVTWLALGSLVRIVSWPLGYAVLAEGKKTIILSIEFTFVLVSVALAWIGVTVAGIEGAAGAFAVLGLLHLATLMYFAARRFKFKMQPWLYGHICFAAFVVSIGRWVGPIWGLCISLVVAFICLRLIVRRLGPTHRLSLAIGKLPFSGWLVSNT